MASRKLKDIKLNEVSLVDKPATKKKFLFFKRGGADKWPTLTKACKR